VAATFVVEDGSGISAANAYISEAAADQYFDDVGQATTWDAVTSKEQCIRDGTRYLDARYGPYWRGRRANIDNVLDWPRTNVDDDDNHSVSSTALPQGLLDACCEAAIRSDSETLTPDVTDEGMIVRRTQKAGDLEETVEYAGGLDQLKSYTIIERLLHDLIDTNGIPMERA